MDSYAAKICSDLVLNGYNDWYLPSKVELNILYVNRDALGGFASGTYWSSSESLSTSAWQHQFYNGSQYTSDKDNLFSVRAVRNF